MTKLVELIVNSLEDGREGDLTKAGIKVTKKSERETMFEKTQDPQIRQSVLGSMLGSEEIDTMKALMDVFEQDANTTSPASVIDPDLLAEFKQEAYEAWDIFQSRAKMGVQIDNDRQLREQQLQAEINSRLEVPINTSSEIIPTSTANKVVTDMSAWGNKKGFESLLAPIDTSRFPEWAAQDTADTLPSGNLVEESESADDDVYSAVEGGVYPLYDSGGPGQGSSTSTGGTTTNHYELPISSSSLDTTASSLVSSITSDPSLSIEDKFAALLKASMTLQQVRSEDGPSIDQATVRQTVDAVSSGRSENLNIETLLGNTMAALARQLDVDLTQTLSQPDSVNDMKVSIRIYHTDHTLFTCCTYMYLLFIVDNPGQQHGRAGGGPDRGRRTERRTLRTPGHLGGRAAQRHRDLPAGQTGE